MLYSILLTGSLQAEEIMKKIEKEEVRTLCRAPHLLMGAIT